MSGASVFSLFLVCSLSLSCVRKEEAQDGTAVLSTPSPKRNFGDGDAEILNSDDPKDFDTSSYELNFENLDTANADSQKNGTDANAFGAPDDDRPCVLILFDNKNPLSLADDSKMHMIQLKNLLGHFPDYDQRYGRVQNYKSGLIDICEATIYLGSVYDAKVPNAFHDDLAETEKPFMWVGYSFWNLPEQVQRSQFGLGYDRLTLLDEDSLDSNGEPSFFRYFHYKGETFYKSFSFQNPETREGINAAFEVVATRTLGVDVKVLSWAEHSYSREQVPYITRNKNFFFVADIPFSYIHEADRYLIFADVLFDFLNQPARHEENFAFLRIEDVHPLISVQTLETIGNIMEDEQIPLNISLVPIYANDALDEGKPLSQRRAYTEVPEFLQWVRATKAEGTEFLLHGLTHHLPGVLNPVGVSGVDYEFWDIVTNAPVTGYDATKTLDILERANAILEPEGIYPNIWLTPHYLASPTDYRIFAGVFPWNLGRITYFDDAPKGQPDPGNPQLTSILQFTPQNSGQLQARRDLFANYSNHFDTNRLGQFFPYEIYGDHYGQRVIPESLGNVTSQPAPGSKKRLVDDILRDAKRNRVLRDTWASVFFHPFLLNTEENGGLGEFADDGRELRRLVQGIKELGYRFIPIGEFMQDQDHVPRTTSRPVGTSR